MKPTNYLSIVLLFSLCLPLGAHTQTVPAPARTQLLLRCDDIGMCHSVNMAVKEVLDAGIPVSASIMFACPWWKEGVEILKQYPHAAHGIHLTLNAEWLNYKWGPVSGWPAVPSLTDSLGYFFPSRATFFANHPLPADAERELRAQIERGIHSGITIDYLDYHMGTAVDTPELRAIVEKLGAEYHLGISRYFGEEDLAGAYAVTPDQKIDTLCAHLRSAAPGAPKLMVFHIGINTPEMAALIDQNSFGLKNVGMHREGELRGLLSREFMQTIREMNLQLITYRDLIQQVGLEHSRRPKP